MSKVPDRSEKIIDCDRIQSALFDYMAHELGAAQSDLIREHLRKCPRCQAEASGVQRAFDILHEASRSESGLPERLSEDRRARILYAYMHPVLDWIYVHHVIISVVITILALLLLFGALRKVRAWRTERLEPGVEVIIGRQADPGAVSVDQ